MTTAARRGFTVRTFLAEGHPHGLQLVEHSQWIGRGLVIPRDLFNDHRTRKELTGTGLYLLSGQSEQTGCERVFISQTGELRDAIDEIDAKLFWDKIIAFVADGPRLHRTHTDYIEARLIQIARETKAAELDNDNEPRVPELYEADEADAEAFIDQLTMMLPMTGVRAFEFVPEASGAQALRLTGKGVSATGYAASGRFVVRSGSTANRQESASLPGHLADLRKSLLTRDVLVEDGKHYKFTVDFAFANAQQAATVLHAERANAEDWNTVAGRGAGASETPGRDANEERRVPTVEVKPIGSTSAATAG